MACGAPCSSISLHHGKRAKNYTLTPKLIALLDYCHAATLYRIDAILDVLKVRYMIYGGTLVGAIRDARRIPWDDDIDLRIHPHDWARLSASSDFRTNWTAAEQQQLWPPVDASNREVFRRWFAQDGAGLTGLKGGIIWNWNFTQAGKQADGRGNWLQAAEPRCMDPDWLLAGGPRPLRRMWANDSTEVLAARKRPTRRVIFVADLVNAAATIGTRSWRRSWNPDAPQFLFMNEAYAFDEPLLRTSLNGVTVSGPSYRMAGRLMVPWYGKAWSEVLEPPSFGECRRACVRESARRAVPVAGNQTEDFDWGLYTKARKRIFSRHQRIAARRRGHFWGLPARVGGRI
jgi:hypothetical protein